LHCEWQGVLLDIQWVCCFRGKITQSGIMELSLDLGQCLKQKKHCVWVLYSVPAVATAFASCVLYRVCVCCIVCVVSCVSGRYRFCIHRVPAVATAFAACDDC
jgi:hypothetical protein